MKNSKLENVISKEEMDLINDALVKISKCGYIPEKISVKYPDNATDKFVDVTDEFIKNQNINTPLPSNNPVENIPFRNCKPAVLFDNYNVYTFNGRHTINTEIYNKVATINNDILNRINTNSMNSFDMNMISKIITTNIQSVSESFIIVLENIYNVFIEKVNDNFYDTESNKQIFELISKPDCINVYMLMDNIMTLLNMEGHTRHEVINNSLFDFVISFVNQAGVSIYNDMRLQMNKFLSSVCGNDDSATSLFRIIDSLFSSMMMNMVYEASIFCNNIIPVIDSLTSRENSIIQSKLLCD